jgi:hypothetical protein
MFDKIMGTDKIGIWLEQGLTPQQIEAAYKPELEAFKAERSKYLIYGESPYFEKYTVLVGGVPIVFDSPPYIDSNSRLMVPLRAIGEALGGQVGWESATGTITVIKNADILKLVINSKTALVNGEQKTMDTSAVIKNSRTMVPVRFAAEYLGSQVEWVPLLQLVIVK